MTTNHRNASEARRGVTLRALDSAAELTDRSLWEWDSITDDLAVDRKTARLYDLAKQRLSNGLRVFANCVALEDQARFRAAVEAAAVSGAPAHERFRMREARGECSRWVDFKPSPRDAKRVLISMDAQDADRGHMSSDRALAERLAVATQAAGIYVWEFDWINLKISWDKDILSSASANRHFGYEFGEDLFDWVHEDDREVGRQAMYGALARGERDTSFRYRLKLADGSIRHIQAYARSTANADGELVSSLGVSWDVTQEVEDAQRLSEQARQLTDAQRRLERASLSVQEGHWELDLRTGQHWASSSYLCLLGLSPESGALDTVEKVTALIHPDDRESSLRMARDYIDRGVAHEIEMRVRTCSDGYRWYRLRANVERDAAGKPVRLGGSIHDVHQQRLTEAALREAQSRLSRAIHGTQDGLWEVDMATGKMWLSPRLCELLGFADGELSDAHDVLRQRVHPADLPISDAAVARNLQEGVSIDIEVRMRMKPGGYRWFRLRGMPATGATSPVQRVSGSMQDVTAAREAHDALIRASDAAQAANKAKSAFLANVSHEIRTPMNGIIGMTSLMLDTGLDAAQRDCADTIRTSAEALLAVINDLLDFSKIEAGKLDIESIDMDLPASVEDVGAIMALQAAGKNVELIINVHPAVPIRVLGDPQRIRQCIINLVGNAIKFTHQGEIVCDISVTAEPAAETAPASGRTRIRFEVRDTGIGVAPEALDSLFQPFVQADSSTTRHFGGTGLGLSIVRRLVELMGGRIGVESALGVGSKFWFELPMMAVPAPGRQAETQPVHNRGRIFVVDDNAANRRVLRAQLLHAGYGVECASGATTALRRLREAGMLGKPFDAVIADFQMPEIDGEMLGKEIIADPMLAKTRVVLLTSMERHGDLERFSTMGFAGYLSKPVRTRELLTCLNRVLNHEAQEWHLHTQPIVTANAAHALPAQRRFAGEVLLVEDNAVNQKVARRFLERLGCTVTVAENGLAAVEAYAAGAFQLVLMDINMPIMDGYAAARGIRKIQDRRPRIPIYALTANAMTGQLDLCHQAGMDGLITKPIDVHQLEDVLRRSGLAPDASMQPTVRARMNGAIDVAALLESDGEFASASLDPRPAVDAPQLMRAVGDDRNFAAELVRTYLDNGRELLDLIRSAAASGEAAQLKGAAHQLKGSSANMHATRLHEMCGALETSALERGSALNRQIEAVAAEFDRVEKALHELVSGPAPLQSAG